MISDAEADGYVRTLLQHFPEKLDEWQEGFLRDIKIRYLDMGETWRLTEKQRAKIDALMEQCAQQHGR